MSPFPMRRADMRYADSVEEMNARLRPAGVEGIPALQSHWTADDDSVKRLEEAAETYEPTRAEYLDAKTAALARPTEKPEWTAPVLFLHASEVAPHEVDEAMDSAAYALSQQHQDDLSLFEAELTKALCAKGMPMVFIQPGAPGHKEAIREAKKHLVQDFASAEPIKPCDHLAYTQGCRACEFIQVRRSS